MFSFDWEFDPFVPFYNKRNRAQIENEPLYDDLWNYLQTSEYNYRIQFEHWEKYTFFIVYNFPNVSIDEIKKDLGDVLRDLHIARTYENALIDTFNSTNEILNSFLNELKKESTKSTKNIKGAKP